MSVIIPRFRFCGLCSVRLNPNNTSDKCAFCIAKSLPRIPLIDRKKNVRRDDAEPRVSE